MFIGITTSFLVFSCCYKLADIRAGVHNDLIQLKFNPKLYILFRPIIWNDKSRI